MPTMMMCLVFCGAEKFANSADVQQDGTADLALFVKWRPSPACCKDLTDWNKDFI